MKPLRRPINHYPLKIHRVSIFLQYIHRLSSANKSIFAFHFMTHSSLPYICPINIQPARVREHTKTSLLIINACLLRHIIYHRTNTPFQIGTIYTRNGGKSRNHCCALPPYVWASCSRHDRRTSIVKQQNVLAKRNTYRPEHCAISVLQNYKPNFFIYT